MEEILIKKDRINLKIDGDIVSLHLSNMEHEVFYRRATDLINAKLDQLKLQNNGLSYESNLKFVALEALTDALRTKHQYESLQNNIQEKMQELATQLSDLST